jgi:hypothetical protein
MATGELLPKEQRTVATSMTAAINERGIGRFPSFITVAARLRPPFGIIPNLERQRATNMLCVHVALARRQSGLVQAALTMNLSRAPGNGARLRLAEA